MATGRPPVFETAEEMQKLIDEYFILIKGEEGILTITGLCLHLGFESRQSFYDYEKKPLFSYTVKRARMMIENAYEYRLAGNNVTGAIFALKNLGWEDRSQRELSGGLEINKKPSWFDDGVEQKTA